MMLLERFFGESPFAADPFGNGTGSDSFTGRKNVEFNYYK